MSLLSLHLRGHRGAFVALPAFAVERSACVLVAQRTRTNDNEAMHLVASRLTEMETKAVADYLSQLP